MGEILTKCQERRLKWYRHVMRREEHYVGRRAMEMEVQGGREKCLREEVWTVRGMISEMRKGMIELHGGVFRHTSTPHKSGTRMNGKKKKTGTWWWRLAHKNVEMVSKDEKRKPGPQRWDIEKTLPDDDEDRPTKMGRRSLKVRRHYQMMMLRNVAHEMFLQLSLCIIPRLLQDSLHWHWCTNHFCQSKHTRYLIGKLCSKTQWHKDGNWTLQSISLDGGLPEVQQENGIPMAAVFAKSGNFVFEKINMEDTPHEKWSKQSYFCQHVMGIVLPPKCPYFATN